MKFSEVWSLLNLARRFVDFSSRIYILQKQKHFYNATTRNMFSHRGPQIKEDKYNTKKLHQTIWKMSARDVWGPPL